MGARARGNAPLVEVEYTGQKRGVFRVRGRVTRTDYRFSVTQSRKFVDRRDAEAGLGVSFRIVPSAPPAPPAPPPPPVVELEPAEPAAVPNEGQVVPPPAVTAEFDFTALKGVGPKTAEVLREGLGFRTLGDLLGAEPEAVASHLSLPGDNVARVQGWQRQAELLQEASTPFA